MTDTQEIFSSIALTQIPGIGLISAKRLIETVGSATKVFENRTCLADIIPSINPRVINDLDCPDAFREAEQELKFIEKNKIECFTFKDERYPLRIRDCDDAPIILFFKGNAEMNRRHVINMVGTRHATEYGKKICETFVRDLKALCPDMLIVSGLAYGIDIYSHRAALSHQMDTIAVLAHGLDRIYPSVHRDAAVRMLEQGGLLTEFKSGTNPDRHNFIQRNRIVAGISDATIVVESASKGGALVTADIADSYHRDCFAFPGRISDPYSEGCNNLIYNNKAALITSAEQFVDIMQWKTKDSQSSPIQRMLFPDLSEEEQLIVNILQEENAQINSLVVKTNIPINKMSVLLFELEMKGIVQVLAGGMYQLLH